mmetsp:Transcript_92948/g.240098  ORF Transcript_92948/g.240098 Transcript_92948/m.240098 type:complete len:229 (+) Transcript_92948:387-1073(+)
MVRLPVLAPPASIMAWRPSMNACGPASAQALPPAFSKEAVIPMNMMLSSTPLEPPMVFPRMLERHSHVAFASARGSLSSSASSLVDAVSIVEPQSASPVFPSSVFSSDLAPMRALHARSIAPLTAESDVAATPSKGSGSDNALAGSGNAGATALGQAAKAVGAFRPCESWSVRRMSDSDTPFMSKEVHSAAGPMSSLTFSAHLDFISAATMIVISIGGTPPRLLTKHA